MNTSEKIHTIKRLTQSYAITGYIVDAEIICLCCTGKIYYDKQKRFSDGRRIRTNDIKKITIYRGILILHTKSKSRYAIINFTMHGIISMVQYIRIREKAKFSIPARIH